MKICLDGVWKLYYFDCSERLTGLCGLETKPYVPAVVPEKRAVRLVL